MTNFHLLVPLLGLSGHVYRTLVWGIRFSTTQDDFIAQLTENYFKSCLSENALMLIYFPKEVSGLSKDVHGFNMPMLGSPTNSWSDLIPFTKISIYSADKGVSWSFPTIGGRTEFRSEIQYVAPGRPISREEFFSKCFEYGIHN